MTILTNFQIVLIAFLASLFFDDKDGLTFILGLALMFMGWKE